MRRPGRGAGSADESKRNGPEGDERSGSGSTGDAVTPADGTIAAAAPSADPTEDTRPPGRFAGLRAVVSRNRLIWIIAAAALVSLIAGLVVGRFVISPADAAANADAPDPGLITAPVDFGELSNDVTIRGEVAYADSVEVKIDVSALSGPAVVTGQVPAVGAELRPLSIALEIAGRPVIVLPGDLPAYRTLRFGVSGPDVVQFKNAMRAVGLDAGDPANNVFDQAAAESVTALYAQAGYPAPASAEDSDAGIRSAQETLRAAEQGLASAKNELASARSGASAVQIREADNEVARAHRELDAARAAVPPDPLRIADLQDAVGLAELKRAQLGGSRDTTAQQNAVDSAASQVTQAEADLAKARQAALPSLPAGEVLFLTQLPRRVDAVTAARGTVLSGAAMTVSGAKLSLSGSAAEADARLLEVGDEAFFELPDGGKQRAVVATLTPAKESGGRWTVALTPDTLTPEQVTQLQGTNVRVDIAVGATEGDVLSVPLAALSSGTGGESRVEVVDGDPRDPNVKTRVVVVETGLAAAGAVEVRPTDGRLEKGDLVVVGR